MSVNSQDLSDRLSMMARRRECSIHLIVEIQKTDSKKDPDHPRHNCCEIFFTPKGRQVMLSAYCGRAAL